MGVVISPMIDVSCDAPTCCNLIHWDQSKVAEDPTAMPDAAFRILTLELFDQTRYTFCDAECLEDFLRELKPLQSPREKAGL